MIVVDLLLYIARLIATHEQFFPQLRLISDYQDQYTKCIHITHGMLDLDTIVTLDSTGPDELERSSDDNE